MKKLSLFLLLLGVVIIAPLSQLDTAFSYYATYYDRYTLTLDASSLDVGSSTVGTTVDIDTTTHSTGKTYSFYLSTIFGSTVYIMDGYSYSSAPYVSDTDFSPTGTPDHESASQSLAITTTEKGIYYGYYQYSMYVWPYDYLSSNKSYFGVYDTGEDIFTEWNGDSSYIAGSVSPKFSAASKNGTSFNWCLVQTSTAPISYPGACDDSGTFGFGSYVTPSWNSLAAGDYYLAIEDDAGVPNFATPTAFTVLAAVSPSLSSAAYTEGEALDMTITIAGGVAPYTVKFYDVSGTLISEIDTITSTSLTSIDITDTISSDGVYYINVTDSSGVYQYDSTGVNAYYAVYNSGEDFVIDYSDSSSANAYDTDAYISYNLSAASTTNQGGNFNWCLMQISTEPTSFPVDPSSSCFSNGSFAFGAIVSSSFSGLTVGDYYMIMEDDQAVFASTTSPVFTVYTPISFTPTVTATNTGVSPLGTIAISGGTAPYTLETYRYNPYNYDFSSTGTTVTLTGESSPYTIADSVDILGLYAFKVVDANGLYTPTYLDSYSVTMYLFTPDNGEDLFFDLTSDPRISLPYIHQDGTYIESYPYIIKDGSSSFGYCFTDSSNLDIVTGVVTDMNNCLTSSTSANADNSAGAQTTINFSSAVGTYYLSAWNSVYNDVTYNYEPDVYATPIVFEVVDSVDIDFNGSSADSSTAEVGDTVQIDFSNVENCDHGCTYYYHTADTVSDMVYTGNSGSVTTATHSFDTSAWDAGTYYFAAYYDDYTSANSGSYDGLLSGYLTLVLSDPDYTDGITAATGSIISGITIGDATGASVDFLSTTVLTDGDGASYTGTIMPPTTVSFTVSNPSGLETAGDVYEVGSATESINLDNSVTVRLPLEASQCDATDLLVYYLNGSGEWVIAGDGGTIVDLGGGTCAMEVTVNHFTKFAVFQTATTTTTTTASGRGGAGVLLLLHNNAEPCEEEDADVEVEDESAEAVAAEFDLAVDEYISRGNYIFVIVKTFSNVLENHQELAVPFVDGVETSKFCPYVKTAHHYGWVKGYADGTFRAGEQINKVEALKTIIEAAELDIATDYKAVYLDLDPSDWYMPYVNFAAEKGIMRGDSEGYFNPTASITLQELAAMIDKVGDFRN